jgi:hypothetical protein
MNRSFTYYITILLLIPAILEFIDPSVLIINIPGSPLTLGRWCFVLAGFVSLSKIKYLKNNRIFIAFIIIQLGLYIGILFSQDILGDLSRTIALNLLLLSAATLSFFWKKKAFQRLLNFTMIVMFIYWVIYISTNVFSGNTLLSYAQLFETGDVLNHHVIGLRVSTSAIYLASQLISSSKTKKNIGYILITIAFTLCLSLQSRSNTLFTLIGGLTLYLINNKVSIKFFLISFPVLIVFATLLFYYLSGFEAISGRFDLTDTDYQSRTNQSRFILIELFFETFIDYPFGKGITNIKLNYSAGKNYFVHNQFLTFIIAGGIFSLIGVVIWIRNLIKISKLILLKKWNYQIPKFETALIVNLIVFSMTLLTVDVSGLLFFFQISFTIYLMSRYREIILNSKYKINK